MANIPQTYSEYTANGRLNYGEHIENIRQTYDEHTSKTAADIQ